MPIFSKPVCILWPHKSTLEFYLNTTDNNFFTFDINLWQELSSADLSSLQNFIQQHHLGSVSVLIPDDVVVTKSFVYDSNITSIELEEIVKLATGSTSFDLTPESIHYELIPQDSQTIIRSEFSDLSRLNILKQNLSNLGLTLNSLTTVSASISHIISTFFQQEYFLIYSLNQNDSFLFLSSGKSVYLTNYLKKSSLNIQKLINYSKLYFGRTVEKIFLPTTNPPELVVTSNLEKTFYDSAQIANSLHLPSSLPLPVLGLLLSSKTSKITKMTDTLPPPTVTPSNNSSKNFLPVVAVFVVTAAVASIAIWFVLNRDKSTDLTDPTGQSLDSTSTISQAPTEVPTPTIAPIDKALKLQVLNATDINGQAATLKAILMEYGFTDITVGNSQETLDANQIRLKPSMSANQAYFQSQLSSQFPATITTELAETSAYDVVFVIGTDLSESSATTTPTTDLTPSPVPTD